ncbi:MAG: DUF2314 domain-containing protein [Pseudomonadota bacterium]
MRWLAALILALLPLGAAAQITNVQGADAQMNAAIADARQTLPFFWNRLVEPGPGESGFMVKVSVPVTHPSVVRELIWAHPISGTPDLFDAELANTPRHFEGLAFETVISVTDDQIVDWIYFQDGRVAGGYTQRLLDARLPVAERAYQDADYVPLPDPATDQ